MTANPMLGQLFAAAAQPVDEYGEKILAAARKQAIEHGLRRTSLDDVARTAEVGRATLFRRFPTRDALLFALAAREAQLAIAAIEANVAGIQDPEEFLVAGALGVITHLTHNALLRRLLVTDPEQMLPLLTVQGDTIMAMGREYLAGHLRRLRANGAAISGDVEVLAEVFARLAVSLTLNPRSKVPLDDPVALEQVMRTTIVPLILHPTPSRRAPKAR